MNSSLGVLILAQLIVEVICMMVSAKMGSVTSPLFALLALFSGGMIFIVKDQG